MKTLHLSPANKAPGLVAGLLFAACSLLGVRADTNTYSTEMLSLDISGGTLPAGVMIRESPTKTSSGQTTIATVGGGGGGGGYIINSFFDIYTELSTDGGATWWPTTNGPVHMVLHGPNPTNWWATNTLPPLTGTYISPQTWHALYAMGIVITNVIHYGFSATFLLPVGYGHCDDHSFASTVSGMMSPDGGLTFVPFSAPAGVTVRICSPPPLIPTVTEWGLIILALLMVIVGMVFILRRRRLKIGTANAQ